MLDCKELTWEQMAEIVHSIWVEMKERNPIGINMYAPTVKAASELLDEIAEGEKDNPTSEDFADPNEREDGYQLGDDPN